MKRMNYSPLTAMLRRIHQATAKSETTGIPVRELLDRDRELRKQLQNQRREEEDRRKFLRNALGFGAGAGILALNPIASANNPNGNGNGNRNQPSIAIVGAGPGGMRTAHRLMQYGFNSTVYEASDRVGGRMWSDNSFFSDNRVIEWGGEFISTEHTALRNLCHQLGLKLEDVNKLSVGDEETYRIDGTLYTESDLMDEWVAGLYQTLKQALKDAPWQPLYNTVHTPSHLLYDNMDARDYLTQIGYGPTHWVHKLLLADLVAEYGLTAGNSALNLIYILAYNNRASGGLPLAGTDERLHVVGGNQQVVQRMADQLPPGSIEYQHKLTQIHGDHAGPYTLHFTDLNGMNPSSTTCDVLVLALPMNLIKELDYIDPRIWENFPLPKQTAFLSSNTSSDNGKVMMEFSERYWDRTRVINGQSIDMAARAYSFNGDASTGYSGFISTWEGEPGNPSPLGLLVNYNGGFEARNLVSTNVNGVLHGVADPADVTRVLNQAEDLWRGISNTYRGLALVSNWIDDPLAKGAFTSPTLGTMTGWWGSQWETEGNIFFAGEAYDVEYWSYMNGAILSAERVAKEIHLAY